MLGNARTLKESDNALMLSFAAGDAEGFELLYKRHCTPIYRFFYFGTHGNSALTAELFEDVWLTVVRGRVRYTNEINFSEWLYHAAWARLHDHLRLHPLDDLLAIPRESTVLKFSSDKDVDTTDSDEASDNYTEHSSDVQPVKNPERTNDALLACICKLSPEQKEVMLLRFCLVMNAQEIADFLDVGKPTVERICREATVLLRQELARIEKLDDTGEADRG